MSRRRERIKTEAMIEIEEKLGRPIEEILEGLYVKHGTLEGVAEELGLSISTISIWMLRLDIPTRQVVEPSAFLGKGNEEEART